MSGFLSQLQLTYIDGRTWRLAEAFEYRVGAPDSPWLLTVPARTLTDFASIPRVFWVLMPPTGTYGKAAVLHDYLYRSGTKSRVIADAIFLEAMTTLGVHGLVRYTMYLGVRLFGRRAYRGTAESW